MNRIRIPLPAAVLIVVAALALALMAGLLSVRADCPEPTPPGRLPPQVSILLRLEKRSLCRWPFRFLSPR